MTTQTERAHLFAQLHVKGDPIILFNIWDAGSAKALQDIGAKAIATGSWSVAAAHGFDDGEKIPLRLAIENAKEICDSVDLPVTIDFEGGYADSPAALHDTIAQVIAAGTVGINFEDQLVGGEGLYSIDEQSTRIKAVREVADNAGVPLFINARTDIFLKASPVDHNDQHLEQALERATAYAEAGGSGFFAPGLRDAGRIEQLCSRSPLPVNIMILPDTPTPKIMADLGVARISYGPGPYRQMIVALQAAARMALAII